MLGKGYRVSMIAAKSDVNQVKALMREIVPSSDFLESSGDSGGMVFNLPINKVKELGSIFSIIDSQKSGNKAQEFNTQLAEGKSKKALQTLIQLVSDVGVSQTSLEEVFMAVTAEE